MDKATKRERARIKADRTPRGELSRIEPKGLGKKNQPAGRFPTRRCSRIKGGKLIFLKRRRKNGEPYSVPMIVGGTPCNNPAVVTKKGKPYCLGCCGEAA